MCQVLKVILSVFCIGFLWSCDLADHSSVSEDLEIMRSGRWVLQSVETNEEIIIPRDQHYDVRFLEDSLFSAALDCNGVTGTYELFKGNKLALELGIQSLINCGSESKGMIMRQLLEKVDQYRLEKEKGKLTLLSSDPNEPVSLTYIVDISTNQQVER